MAESVGGPSVGTAVEFVGLPGAGKSTIAHALATNLRSEGLVALEPTRQLDHLMSPRARALRKATLALHGALHSPRAAQRCVGAIRDSQQPTRRETWHLTVNLLYLTELARRASIVPGVHILDQGLLQALWSVAYRGTADTEVSAAVDLVSALLGPQVTVVVVDTPLDVVARRLTTRLTGASRLERDLSAANGRALLDRAVAAMANVEAVVAQLARRNRISCLRVFGGGERPPWETAQRLALSVRACPSPPVLTPETVP